MGTRGGASWFSSSLLLRKTSLSELQDGDHGPVLHLCSVIPVHSPSPERIHREGRVGPWLPDRLVTGLGDFRGRDRGVHPGGVGTARLFSAKTVQRCDAGELQEPGVAWISC